MKLCILCILASVFSLGAQAPPPPDKTVDIDLGHLKPGAEITPATVVATVNGVSITAGQLEMIVRSHPPQAQKLYESNPKQFLRDYAMYKLMESEAVKNKLAEQSPYKEQIDFLKMYALVNAQANHFQTAMVVSADDEKKHYEANKSKYHEAKAKVIYIPFTKDNEAESKAKAESVVKAAREGSDFVQLVKEHSQEPASKAKDGDLGIGVRAGTQQVPEAFRKVILATKVGEITDPLRLDNGFYVFKIQSSGVIPYDQVRGEIFQELKQAGFIKWQQDMRAQAAVTFTNEAFFQPRTAPKP